MTRRVLLLTVLLAALASAPGAQLCAAPGADMMPCQGLSCSEVSSEPGTSVAPSALSPRIQPDQTATPVLVLLGTQRGLATPTVLAGGWVLARSRSSAPSSRFALTVIQRI